MKKKNGKLIILSAVISLVLVAAIVVGAVFVRPELESREWLEYSESVQKVSESDVLDYFSSESDYTYDINDISKEIEEYHDNQTDRADLAEEWIETAEDVPEECAEYFQKVNDTIIQYFKDEYSISVEDELAVYGVKMLDIPEKYSIGGFYMCYAPDEDKPEKIGEMSVEEVERTIFINSDAIELANVGNGEWYFEEITGTYVHETLHYLGFMAVNESMSSIIEGFTEATTIDIMDYAEYSYFSNAYPGNVKLARQIMLVNNELVPEMITTEKFGDEILIADLTEKLGAEQAKDLGQAHNTVNDGFWNYSFYDGNYECLEIAQYLTAEYCKNFELKDKEIIEIYSYFLVPVSDI